MKVLVTGADGFVGVWLTRRLHADGHDVVAAVQPERPLLRVGGPPPWPADVRTVPLELLDDLSVRKALGERLDAVVHLAAMASGAQAGNAPEQARLINVDGTLRIAGELARQRRAGESDAKLLLVSTAEVYGAGRGEPRMETDPAQPISVYAETKLEAERGVLEVSQRGGLHVIIARPFPHTGRGQDHRFVAPVFAKRIMDAKRARARCPSGISTRCASSCT